MPPTALVATQVTREIKKHTLNSKNSAVSMLMAPGSALRFKTSKVMIRQVKDEMNAMGNAEEKSSESLRIL